MDPRSFLGEFAGDPAFAESLVHVEELPEREPEVLPFPDVPELLVQRLGLLGIDGLYPHQRDALDSVASGSNVVISTGTASGKTLV